MTNTTIRLAVLGLGLEKHQDEVQAADRGSCSALDLLSSLEATRLRPDKLQDLHSDLLNLQRPETRQQSIYLFQRMRGDWHLGQVGQACCGATSFLSDRYNIAPATSE